MRESGLKGLQAEQSANAQQHPAKSSLKRLGKGKKSLGTPPTIDQTSSAQSYSTQDPYFASNKYDIDSFNPYDNPHHHKYGVSQQSIGWAGYHFLLSKGAHIGIADSITGADAARLRQPPRRTGACRSQLRPDRGHLPADRAR